MMNRSERRNAVPRRRRTRMDANQMFKVCDCIVDAKVGQIVMIMANTNGRKVVEDLWPDVQWGTDEIFARPHLSDWLFTLVRVTKLPPELEETTPLSFAKPDALGFAVATALQYFAEPKRVAHYVGQGENMKVNFYGSALGAKEMARALFVEHVPPGLVRL